MTSAALISRRRAIAGTAALCLAGLMPRRILAAAEASDLPVHPLADRLAAYAAELRFEDLDAATVERVKTHVIDTLGCGIGAFDEKPVRICRHRHQPENDPRSRVLCQRRRVPLPRLQRRLRGALRDPRILAFMQKIKVHEDPVLTARVGAAVPTRVTAMLADGRRISRGVDFAPGFPGRPMSRLELERKFRGNIAKRWPEARTSAILEAFWNLDRMDDVAALLGRLALQPNS